MDERRREDQEREERELRREESVSLSSSRFQRMHE